jgi:hypothetical protein
MKIAETMSVSRVLKLLSQCGRWSQQDIREIVTVLLWPEEATGMSVAAASLQLGSCFLVFFRGLHSSAGSRTPIRFSVENVLAGVRLSLNAGVPADVSVSTGALAGLFIALNPAVGYLQQYPGICQDTRYAGRDSNPSPPEYKRRMLALL